MAEQEVKKTCSWPMPTGKYCGEPVRPNYPYCQDHAYKALQIAEKLLAD